MFGALLEYSIILLRIKIYSMQVKSPVPPSMDLDGASGGNPNGTGGGGGMAGIGGPGGNGIGGSNHALPINSVHSNSFKVMKKNQLVARFDIFCLIFFPLLFMLFMTVYTLVIVLL